MSDAIKTINLDDVGGLQSPTKDIIQAANLVYRSQAQGSDAGQTSVSAMTEPTQATQTQATQGFASGFGTSFTRVTEVFGELNDSPRKRLIVIAILGLLVVGLVIFFISSNEEAAPPESTASEPATPTPTASENTAAKPAETAASGSVDLSNPYWSLPNPLDVPTAPGEQGILAPSQEERWRQGLAHPFVWQRFKTVSEIRAAHLKGSEFLLTDALAQPKFWTRMEALLALAEMGETVDIDAVEGGIGTTRRALVQNYFRRFRQSITAGELYIMRQAIRIVDAGTRRVILENLLERRDATNELYLVAATYDPNVKVNAWIKHALAAKPLSPDAKARFEQLASAPAAAATPDQAEPATAAPASDKVQDLKVEQVPDDVHVEEVIFLKDDEKVKEAPADDGFERLEGEGQGG